MIKQHNKMGNTKKLSTKKQCDIDVVNNKIEGEKYKYMHSGDCIIYVTMCENCKKEIGDWTPENADKKWEEHCC